MHEASRHNEVQSKFLSIFMFMLKISFSSSNTDGYPFPGGWEETAKKSSVQSERILQSFYKKCKEKNVRNTCSVS